MSYQSTLISQIQPIIEEFVLKIAAAVETEARESLLATIFANVGGNVTPAAVVRRPGRKAAVPAKVAPVRKAPVQKAPAPKAAAPKAPAPAPIPAPAPKAPVVKAKRHITNTPALQAARKLQGMYLGRLRKLNVGEKKQVKSIAKQLSVRDAIRLADEIIANRD